MKHKLTGLLDLDGTLVGSESLKMESHRETVRSFGAELPNDFEFPVGASRERVVQTLMDASGLGSDYDDYCAAYQAIYNPKRAGIQVMPNVLCMLELLQRDGIRLCLVTSSNRKDMQAALDATGLNSYFEHKVSADDVINKKPNPEPYQLGMNLMEVAKEQCFILEDTESGVRAGVAARVKTFAFDRGHNHDLEGCGALTVFSNDTAPEDILKSIQSSFSEQ